MLSSLGKKIVTIWGTALILLFFSEFYFLNELSAEMVIMGLSDPLELIIFLFEFSIYYALFATIYLVVLDCFHVKTILPLVLAGALFGWATEALVIPAAYEAVPISLIFPSISWHSVVDVLFGWYFIRRLMRLNNSLLLTTLFVGVGIIWAFWATWFWSDTDPNAFMPIVPTAFTGFVFATSVLWIVGMILTDYFGREALIFSKWEVGCVLLITTILFVMMALPYLPFSLVLAPMIALTIFALYRGKLVHTIADHLQVLSEPPPKFAYYFLVLLSPLTASIIYPILYENKIGIPSEDIIFLLFTIGLLIYLIALVRPFFMKINPNTNLD